MRRVFSVLFILVCLVGLSCRTLLPTPAPTTTPTAVPLPSPTPTATAAPTATPAPAQGFHVIYHPDGGLYAGDQVSFEVVSPPGMSMEDSHVEVTLDNRAGSPTLSGGFSPSGIEGRMQATLVWAWDTRGLAPGAYTLRYTVLPANLSWLETVTLLPAEDLPLAEQQAAWAETANACCSVAYITHTAAERDLADLLALTESTAKDLMDSLGITPDQPIAIAYLPRLLGQGGFTTDAIYLSYLDRNYAGGDIGMITRHEMVHVLDKRLGGDLRPDILAEGLAVYLAGGHYQPGALLPRAAALLGTWGSPPQPGLERYLPLTELADHFYTSQHEIGYIQAGALVETMVQTWGWEAYNSFYRDIHPDPGGSQAQAIDAALQEHFGLSLSQLEQDFIAALRQQPASEEVRQDVLLTITYYDAMRTYQRLFDRSAYFLTAWLPDPQAMRLKAITADFVRHPREAPNLALETLFITTHEQFVAGQYGRASRSLAAIQRVLQAVEQGAAEPFNADPLAAEYLLLVQILLDSPEFSLDDELQRLEVGSETATAWVSGPTAGLFEVSFVRAETGWQLQPEKIEVK